MFNYIKLVFLFSLINSAVDGEHLSYEEWETKFDEYEQALREQMRPNSMADTILLIHKLDKAVKTDPKDWDWKLRPTNSTLISAPHFAAEIDAARVLGILEKYELNGLNTSIGSPDKLKDLGTKIKDQTKLYKKTMTHFEKPVFSYQTRRERRRKLRQEITNKLLGTSSGATTATQIYVMHVPILIISAYQILT